MNDRRIISIGGGNMARAIIGGLLAEGYKKSAISVVDPDAGARAVMADECGVETMARAPVINNDDMVLLAVKPQIMRSVVTDLSASCAPAAPLLISIAAGITATQIGRWFGHLTPIVRVMPNTPALIKRGAAALFATPGVSAADKQAAENILSAVGLALWVEREELLDAVTALSGSGPAYFFLVIELLAQIGAELGLDEDVAQQLAIATASGASQLAQESSHPPATLREQVTSPGGTTERALSILANGDLENLLREALTGAQQRSRELAQASED